MKWYNRFPFQFFRHMLKRCEGTGMVSGFECVHCFKEACEIAERDSREIYDSVHHRFIGEDDDEPCLQCGKFDIEPIHQSFQSWSREVDSMFGN